MVQRPLEYMNQEEQIFAAMLTSKFLLFIGLDNAAFLWANQSSGINMRRHILGMYPRNLCNDVYPRIFATTCSPMRHYWLHHNFILAGSCGRPHAVVLVDAHRPCNLFIFYDKILFLLEINSLIVLVLGLCFYFFTSCHAFLFFKKVVIRK
jgi:hypothetical protein